ncbi:MULTISPECIES: hypothetical protein [unclassified Helicobacter]|nr:MULTISPECIES: hypothetical protein [unclassified Helicobacter]
MIIADVFQILAPSQNLPKNPLENLPENLARFWHFRFSRAT